MALHRMLPPLPWGHMGMHTAFDDGAVVGRETMNVT